MNARQRRKHDRKDPLYGDVVTKVTPLDDKGDPIKSGTVVVGGEGEVTVTYMDLQVVHMDRPLVQHE